MKTLREYIDQLDEISRRDVLKGIGAAAAGAVLGQPKDAEADRTWSTDPVSDKWHASMTSENYPGAYLFWDEDRNNVTIELTSPTNWSPAAVKEKRLHFPKITNASYMLRLGNSQPISGKGILGTAPARDYGNYRYHGLILTDDKNKMSKIRDEFINADKVAVRLEIDGNPRSIVFHENPYLLQQRQQRQQQSQQQSQNNLGSGLRVDKFLKN
jgi:hypothetical protein